jgi:hypothetical protein
MPSKKIRTKTCPKCRKGIYRTKGAVISEIVRRISAGAKPLRYYRCPHDEGADVFHITSQYKK